MSQSRPRAELQRRGFLSWVSASVSASLAGCQDEPIVGHEPTEPVPEAIDYQELLLEYFGEAGLNDAQSIGGYHVEISKLSSLEAYEATSETRALVDEAGEIPIALTSLDQRVLQNFAELSVVDVAGWTLSRSEVDLCILAWLG